MLIKLPEAGQFVKALTSEEWESGERFQTKGNIYKIIGIADRSGASCFIGDLDEPVYIDENSLELYEIYTGEKESQKGCKIKCEEGDNMEHLVEALEEQIRTVSEMKKYYKYDSYEYSKLTTAELGYFSSLEDILDTHNDIKEIQEYFNSVQSKSDCHKAVAEEDAEDDIELLELFRVIGDTLFDIFSEGDDEEFEKKVIREALDALKRQSFNE